MSKGHRLSKVQLLFKAIVAFHGRNHFRRCTRFSGPEARSIPAWGEAPRMPRRYAEGPEARSIWTRPKGERSDSASASFAGYPIKTALSSRMEEHETPATHQAVALALPAIIPSVARSPF